MKSQTEEVEGGSLSEEQRLQLLTKAGRRNRLFIFGLAGVLGCLMLVSAGLNIYSLVSSTDDARMVALEKQVKRLEQQGLLQRKRSASDEREVHLALTPAGCALREQVLPLKSQLLCERGIDLDQVAALRSQVGVLLDQFMALNH